MIATEKQVKSIAEIIVAKHGRDSAIDYCKAKIFDYEQRNKELEFCRGALNEVAANKIMIEFYLAVSLMIRNE